METVAEFVDDKIFREGMSLLATAVNIVTTTGNDGPVGLTASAVCSVTSAPPTLLVCVNVGSSVGASFAETTNLCVNTVGPDHLELAKLFGGKTPMADRFAAASWTTRRSGAPVLDGAVVTFDCRVQKRTQIGTHMVLFCQIVDIQMSPNPVASAYFGRRFHDLRS